MAALIDDELTPESAGRLKALLGDGGCPGLADLAELEIEFFKPRHRAGEEEEELCRQ